MCHISNITALNIFAFVLSTDVPLFCRPTRSTRQQACPKTNPNWLCSSTGCSQLLLNNNLNFQIFPSGNRRGRSTQRFWWVSVLFGKCSITSVWELFTCICLYATSHTTHATNKQQNIIWQSIPRSPDALIVNVQPVCVCATHVSCPNWCSPYFPGSQSVCHQLLQTRLGTGRLGEQFLLQWILQINLSSINYTLMTLV